ncbi:unnamed protein product [Anisakis simplex]|uniref:Slo-interacting protein 1 (inferred by orthology to a D. melanogaster protein) n=1 Tax=Anisakis simplex TaxID=6269 RepID=A0A158PNK0_ANISI|nr:unnamed protein product [Anisakis simplex]
MAVIRLYVNEYEEVKMDDEQLTCVGTQTDPVTSDEEEEEGGNHLSDHMDEVYIDDGDCELNALEYEEVVLKRSSSCHRLGLTLCYGATDDNDTDIFISEIEAGSIADRDGRLRPGDQILQVNGEPIHSRLDAIEQFRSNRCEIMILLARTAQLVDDDECYDLNMTSDRRSTGDVCSVGLLAESSTVMRNDDRGTFTDANSVNSSAFEKDSGVSRMTDSDAEILPPLSGSSKATVIPSSSLQQQQICSSLYNNNGNKNYVEEDMFLINSSNDRKLRRCESDASLERELASLHREMETIRIECDRLISKHNSAEKRVAQQVAKANSLMNTIGELSCKGDSQRRVDETSTSAYNTGGESCRSTPLKSDYTRPQSSRNPTIQITHVPTEPVYHQLDEVKPAATTTTMIPSYETLSRQMPSTSQPSHVKFRLPQYSVVLREPTSICKKSSAVLTGTTTATTAVSNLAKKENCASSHAACCSYKPGDTMYTSPEKLAETIALQQRLLRQAMIEQANMLKPHNNNTFHKNNEEPFEWKIKRRSDGTRYITKRPIRNRLLREREQQLNKERTGISTDDDAMSELKTGRFWSREERKKHLERAKERKMRQHQMLAERQQRPSDQMIVQLSHKKMMRRKGQMLFDKFTTVQEFLAHGNRDPSTNRANDGILSVTTV